MEPWYGVYNHDLGAGFVALTLFPKGDSTVMLTCNLGEKQEIGHYQHKVSLEVAQNTRNILQQAGYKTLPPPPPLPPETASITIGEGVEGSMPENHVFPLGTLPQVLTPVMDEMSRRIEEIRLHPLRVLQGSAAWEAAQFESGGDISFVITFRNIGTMPIEITNPGGASEDDQVRLFLAVAKDKPDDQISEEDVADVEPGTANVSAVPKPGEKLGPQGPTVVIGAGDELLIRVRKSVYLAPGRYKGVVTFHSVAGNIDVDRAVDGALAMDIGTFQIVKK